jgi:hypothetical protein
VLHEPPRSGGLSRPDAHRLVCPHWLGIQRQITRIAMGRAAGKQKLSAARKYLIQSAIRSMPYHASG